MMRRWRPTFVKLISPPSRNLIKVGREIPRKSAACCVVSFMSCGMIDTPRPLASASAACLSTSKSFAGSSTTSPVAEVRIALCCV